MAKTILDRRRHPSLKRAREDGVIEIRVSVQTKAILNRAAALRGQKLSEFILVSAHRQAEEVILSQPIFFLEPSAHNKFLALLDSPPTPKRKIIERLYRKAPWES